MKVRHYRISKYGKYLYMDKQKNFVDKHGQTMYRYIFIFLIFERKVHTGGYVDFVKHCARAQSAILAILYFRRCRNLVNMNFRALSDVVY